MPIGRLYFFNPKISTRTGNNSNPIETQNPMDGGYSNATGTYTIDPVTGKRTLNAQNSGTFNKTGGQQYSTTSLYDSFYASSYDDEGTALYNRTRGSVYLQSGITLNVINGSTYTSGVTSTLYLGLTGLTQTQDGRLVGPTGVPFDTEEFLSSLKITSSASFSASTGVVTTAGIAPYGTPLNFSLSAQKYGQPIVRRMTGNYGQIEIELDLSAPTGAGGYAAMIPNITIPTFYASYMVYSDLEEDSNIAEVTVDFDFVTVDVSTRKLRANFTPEVQADVNVFQSIDIEAELTALISETVSSEIDREILRDLRRGCSWKLRWNYAGYDAMIAMGTAVGITRKDYNQELITKINQISAVIQKSTLRGGASWVVVSPEISAIFNDLEYFHVTNAEASETKYSMGIEKIGSIQGRYTVYVDTYAPANTVLIGHKGDGIFHAGYIYAPYVPLMLVPRMVNPNNYSTILGCMTRYAKKMVNNRFFGKVIVDNAPFFGTTWI